MVLRREHDALQRKLSSAEALLNDLANAPEDVAKAALGELRAGSDPDTVLEMIKSDTMLDNSSQESTARATLSPVHTGPEVELTVRHSVAYSLLEVSEENELSSNSLPGSSNMPELSAHMEPGVSDESSEISEPLPQTLEPVATTSSKQISISHNGSVFPLQQNNENDPHFQIGSILATCCHDSQLENIAIAL